MVYRFLLHHKNTMTLYQKLLNHDEKLSLIGLGYVGMPIAVAFAEKGIDVIGFDTNESKINLYMRTLQNSSTKSYIFAPVS